MKVNDKSFKRLFAIPGTLLAGIALVGLPSLLRPAHAQSVEPAVNVLVVTGNRHQTIEGWGTSLAWWTDTAIVSTPEWRSAYRQLGANILRIDMQKEALVARNGDFRTPVRLSDDLESNIALMDFTRDDIRVFGETAQWLSQNALEPDRVLIVGSIWSPPHWMKRPTGNSQAWVGGNESRPTPWLSGEFSNAQTVVTGDSIGGRLATEDAETLQQYGNYIAAWVAGFERTYETSLYAISIQNESTFENPFDSMVLNIAQSGAEDYRQYAIALNAVREAWRRNGLSTRIKGPHVAQIGPTPSNPWSLLHQMRMIDAVRTFDDSSLIDFIDFYNSNYYMPATEEGAQATAAYLSGIDVVDADWADWAEGRGLAADGKPIWISEASGEHPDWRNGPNGTAGDGALSLAVKIFNALAHANAVTYLYWQLTDDEVNPGLENLIGRSQVAQPLSSKKYVTYMHFSRYTRPGAVRIDAQFEDGTSTVHGASQYDALNGLSALAFLHEQDRTLTSILLNATGEDRIVSVELPDDLRVATFAAFRTSDTEDFSDLPPIPSLDTPAQVIVPAYSLVTLVGEF